MTRWPSVAAKERSGYGLEVESLAAKEGRDGIFSDGETETK